MNANYNFGGDIQKKLRNCRKYSRHVRKQLFGHFFRFPSLARGVGSLLGSKFIIPLSLFFIGVSIPKTNNELLPMISSEELRTILANITLYDCDQRSIID